ncbi:MAG TPA: aspartate 1-decarboxylase [Nitrospinae bacterium]|nr:aspartate 1-decarboxylase [Nitrospinota bacterium]HBA27119.1 aspartate 1-decarboxylase [Nitrospinota bacterium]
MKRIMLKAKIHRAQVTDANINYEGSIEIDSEFLKAVDILPFEQVQVYDINNGNRFETYAIEGKAGSGIISVNGAAARLVTIGDLVIIASYGVMDEKEARGMKPKIIKFDGKNKLKKQPRTLKPQPNNLP